jgi:hypothetical protein
MVTTEVQAPGGVAVVRCWLARVALVAAAGAVLVAPVVAGLRQSLALVLVGLDNASFGAYAAVVQSPASRDDETRTTLDQLPGLLAGQTGPRLVAGTRWRGLTRLAGREVVVDADAAQVPVGVDGEALVLATPVRCVLRPAALRVRVPRDRPGVPDPKPIMDWKRLRQIALTVPGTGRG